MAIIDKIQLSGTVYTIGNETTTAVTSASTDNEIPTAKAVYDAIPQGGGGKTIVGGRGITVTSGETADTVSFNLPISGGGSSNLSVVGGINTSASFNYSFVFGSNLRQNGGSCCALFGDSCKSNGSYAFAGGWLSEAKREGGFAYGLYVFTKNKWEHSVGQYNNSVSASTTFGDSGNTLFSVGNGTANNARHNAFEIRQNGDIYLTSGGTDIKLQDHLGGGGSSINVVQTTGSSTTDVMSQDAVTTQLSGYVTTNTEQTISGRKVFTYSASSGKAIEFKQTNDSAKVGFGIKNSASTNNEVASFEFRPNTFTIDGVQHPLMYFGHYRNNNTANAGVPQTVIGFRQYDQKNAAAYHYLMPLPEKAKTPFSLTTSFKDYYAPMGFKNGSTMITADNTGVADFSSVLGGLKLVKLSQSDYNALTTKDDNTVYFIGDSTNGYTMKIGSANVN